MNNLRQKVLALAPGAFSRLPAPFAQKNDNKRPAEGRTQSRRKTQGQKPAATTVE